MRRRPERRVSGFYFRYIESKISVSSGGTQQILAIWVRTQKMKQKEKSKGLTVVGIIKEKMSRD